MSDEEDRESGSSSEGEEEEQKEQGSSGASDDDDGEEKSEESEQSEPEEKKKSSSSSSSSKVCHRKNFCSIFFWTKLFILIFCVCSFFLGSLLNCLLFKIKLPSFYSKKKRRRRKRRVATLMTLMTTPTAKVARKKGKNPVPFTFLFPIWLYLFADPISLQNPLLAWKTKASTHQTSFRFFSLLYICWYSCTLKGRPRRRAAPTSFAHCSSFLFLCQNHDFSFLHSTTHCPGWWGWRWWIRSFFCCMNKHRTLLVIFSRWSMETKFWKKP